MNTHLHRMGSQRVSQPGSTPCGRLPCTHGVVTSQRCAGQHKEKILLDPGVEHTPGHGALAAPKQLAQFESAKPPYCCRPCSPCSTPGIVLSHPLVVS